MQDYSEKNIQSGTSLTKEMWELAINGLMAATPVFERFFKAMDFNGKGAENAEVFMQDMTLALAAMQYVAEYALDKVRFIPLTDTDINKAYEFMKERFDANV